MMSSKDMQMTHKPIERIETEEEEQEGTLILHKLLMSRENPV
jgi:hypothetical protein